MFTIRIDGVEEAKAAWLAGCAQVVTDLRHGVSNTVQATAHQIRSDAPEKTGELRDKMHTHVRSNVNGASGDVQLTADHASYVRDGTGPHPIVARNAQALRFTIAGRVVFRKSVQHPGTKPNDFTKNGIERGQQLLERDANASLARLKARIEG